MMMNLTSLQEFLITCLRIIPQSFVKFFRSKSQTRNIEKKFTFCNTKYVNGRPNLFQNELENNLIPIANEFSSFCITRENFDFHFDKLLTAISDVIDKHAPSYTASRK